MIKSLLKNHVPENIWRRLRIYRRSFLPFRMDGRGERVSIDRNHIVPFEEMDMYQKSHVRRYEFACSLIKEKNVRGDFACGTGYGTVMLAEYAQQAIGADIDKRVIREITERYKDKKNITFIHKNLLDLSFTDTFDAVVSFETIEHFKETDIPRLFRVFGRSLKPGGMLIFSTPYLQQPTKEALDSGFHLTFNIDEKKINSWLLDAEFSEATFSYQNYDTHEISPSLDEKHFIIGVAKKL